MLSHNFWQRRFGGNPAIVGQTVTLNGRAFTIVGVTTEGFHGTEPYLNIDLWVPMSMQPAVMSGGDRLSSRGQLWLEVFVRLKPGVPHRRALKRTSVWSRATWPRPIPTLPAAA